MSLNIDVFKRYTGPRLEARFSDNQWDVIHHALDNLSNNSVLSNYLNRYSSFGSIEVSRSQDGYANANWSQSSLTIRVSSLALSGVDALDPNHNTIHLGLDRILFHELIHAQFDDTDNLVNYKVAYQREERAIFLENTLFVSQFGGGERVGHGPVSSLSASSTSYLTDSTLTNSGQNSIFVFNGEGDIITKDYNSFEKTIDASLSYTYDHYIKIDIRSNLPLLSADGSVINDRFLRIIENSVQSNAVIKIASASESAVLALSLKGYLQDSAFVYASFGSKAPDLPIFNLSQSSAQTVSAEAFSDSYNQGPIRTYYGPAGVDTVLAPPILAVLGDPNADSVVIGGSGYHEKGADLTGTSDDILAGAGDDIIILGDSSGNDENNAVAGSGNDIVIGGSGTDHINGGSGADLLSGGPGADYLIGGAGFDIVSYASAATGVVVDLRLRDSDQANGQNIVVGLKTNGLDSDATGDRVGSVEGFIGSVYSDTFYSDSGSYLASADHGFVLFGADGNDNLFGENGDVLIGGNGNDNIVIGSTGFVRINPGEGYDNIYIETGNQNSRVVIINGGDADDTIFWNGWQYIDDATLTVIDDEKEYDENGEVISETYAIDIINSQGFRLVGGGDGEGNIDLSLTSPDGVTTIIIDNFHNGDLGIHLGFAETQYATGATNLFTVNVDDLPRTVFCDNGNIEDASFIPFLDQSQFYSNYFGGSQADFMLGN